MTIILKNKDTLMFKEFCFKCCIGRNGITNNKIEGDKKTPKGKYSLGNLYYRKDRNNKPDTRLKCIPIKKNMAWCNDVTDKFNYNKLIKVNKKKLNEKMYRIDYKYDFVIPIKYNSSKTKLGKGSAIFLHLTKNYRATAGCVAILKKDFLVLLKVINKKTIIKIV